MPTKEQKRIQNSYDISSNSIRRGGRGGESIRELTLWRRREKLEQILLLQVYNQTLRLVCSTKEKFKSTTVAIGQICTYMFVYCFSRILLFNSDARDLFLSFASFQCVASVTSGAYSKTSLGVLE